MRERTKPELLAPAGDFERLRMAVLYGADAVYLAGTAFGMRSFAGNFAPEELPGAVAFAHCGKALFEVFKYLGVADIAWNQPKTLPYPTENPFA